MTQLMATRDNNATDILSDPGPVEPLPSAAEDGEPTRNFVLSLAHRITSLVDDSEDVELEDPDLSHRLALSVKPYVDRLVTLRHLLDPVSRSSKGAGAWHHQCRGGEPGSG